MWGTNKHRIVIAFSSSSVVNIFIVIKTGIVISFMVAALIAITLTVVSRIVSNLTLFSYFDDILDNLFENTLFFSYVFLSYSLLLFVLLLFIVSSHTGSFELQWETALPGSLL